ncbi:Acetyl-coenzyme A synthetase 2-like, mitochondrial [Nymphon striatum]|nr:Acetyl-coenzyme A synthetase 2-like, mitochondrial [Nymphon striatum]
MLTKFVRFSSKLFKSQQTFTIFDYVIPESVSRASVLPASQVIYRNVGSNASNGGITSTPMPEIAEMGASFKTHQELYEFSLQNPDKFWSVLARSRIRWQKEFQDVSNCDMNTGEVSWFDGGILNVADNCIDRHVEKNPTKTALIWEKDEPGQEEKVTYKELQTMTNKLANTLKNLGVCKGDPVAIYMPVSPISVAAMLACARIGAVHTVVFAGFSAIALANRIQDAGAKVLLTTDQGVRGGKMIELKKTADDAVAMCPTIEHVLVSKRTGNSVPMNKKDIWLEELMKNESEVCSSEPMESKDLLFMLYTSGSTGKPKGIAHCQAGYLLYANITHKHVFDYHDGDIYGCVADIGWITGHSYVVYGPLSNGATTVLFESTPTYPDPGRYWETVERLKINQFYGAPTAIRLLLKYGDEWVKKYDRSSLKTIGSVGEPINHEAWEWYYNVVGEKRCSLVDTWWQTETGGIAISPRPSQPGAEIKPGMPMRPMFGIKPVLLNEKGEVLSGNKVSGALCIGQPWPGMAKTIYGNHKRFLETYYHPYPGFYFSGDGAYRDENGYYQITGRMDDVINVRGHRLGTAEIEDIMDEHPDVAETAVVGYPHPIKGESVYAYIILKDNVHKSTEAIVQDLRESVKSNIASYAIPDYIQICSGLPKTRSGKIMRRILRKIAANKPDELGDTSTLADPSVVEEILENHEAMTKK